MWKVQESRDKMITWYSFQMFDDNNNNNNKDNNNLVHKYFKVKSIPGKGLGLVSTRDIAGKIINKGFQSDISNTSQFNFSWHQGVGGEQCPHCWPPCYDEGESGLCPASSMAQPADLAGSGLPQYLGHAEHLAPGGSWTPPAAPVLGVHWLLPPSGIPCCPQCPSGQVTTCQVIQLP